MNESWNQSLPAQRPRALFPATALIFAGSSPWPRRDLGLRLRSVPFFLLFLIKKCKIRKKKGTGRRRLRLMRRQAQSNSPSFGLSPPSFGPQEEREFEPPQCPGGFVANSLSRAQMAGESREIQKSEILGSCYTARDIGTLLLEAAVAFKRREVFQTQERSNCLISTDFPGRLFLSHLSHRLEASTRLLEVGKGDGRERKADRHLIFFFSLRLNR